MVEERCMELTCLHLILLEASFSVSQCHKLAGRQEEGYTTARRGFPERSLFICTAAVSKAALRLSGKWQIWIMHTYNPTQTNSRHGGLTKAKSWGCVRPESADYTLDALDNAPKCVSWRAWNPWSINAALSFAINMQSCLHVCAPLCPKTNTFKALKEPPLWIAIFLAVDYSMRGCHNKGNNKRGHVPALHGVSVSINKRKAMSHVGARYQERWYLCSDWGGTQAPAWRIPHGEYK